MSGNKPTLLALDDDVQMGDIVRALAVEAGFLPSITTVPEAAAGTPR